MILNMRKLIILLGLGVLFGTQIQAQCGKFVDTPDEEEALRTHVLYRDQIKAENYDAAFADWKKVYEMAPAADGKRATHYEDGRAIYLHKMQSATEAEKTEYRKIIMRLYDEQIACYGGEGKTASIRAYQAFDMFYDLESPYADIEKILKSSMEESGNDFEYFAFLPYAYVVVDLFNEKAMSKEDARSVYTKLNEIADFQVSSGGEYAEDYATAKTDIADVFVAIEDGIFDCDYFKDKLVPEYQAAPDDQDVLQRIYNKLVQKGCDQNLPIMMEMKGKYEKIIAAKNAAAQKEYEANNPLALARKMIEAGDHRGALAKYEEGLAKASSDNEKAEIYLGMASLQGRHLGSPSKGRQLALKAAGLKSSWGKPYMLIGDLYAKGARNCGDAYNQRLAILAATEKYSYAKSIDPSVASDASKRISSYRSSRPDKETAFMMGHKEGSKVKVGCWIGETVTLRF